MNGTYPQYQTLVQQLAKKVISRIVQDGVGMEDAIKESIHYADLDRQQVIHLCFTLQEYGLTSNNDPKDYFHTSKDMGKAFPSVDNGYVVYANKKNELAPVFAAIEEMKAAGFTSAEISSINPELNNILSLVDEYQQKYFDIMNNKSQPQLQMAAGLISSREITAQVNVEPATPDNVNNVLNDGDKPEVEPASPAPAPEPSETPTDAGGDETFFQDEESAAPSAGGATVTISPSPSELKEQIGKAPKWTVENVLSIDKAKAYYEKMKKDLEDVVLNDKITIGEELMKEYNDARSSIDEAINKIDDAQKDTQKLEEKKDDIEQEYEEVPGNEKPTDALLSQNEGEVPAPPAPLAETPAAQPAPK